MDTYELVEHMLSKPELRKALSEIIKIESLVRKQTREYLVIYSTMSDRSMSVQDALTYLFTCDHLDESAKSAVIELLGDRSTVVDQVLRIQ